MSLEIPAAPRLVMEAIAKDGYSCYLVGGCVRDLLLGRQPADYDFVTERSPAEIIAAATKAGWEARQQGASFGVVKVLAWGKGYEIATMRSEAYGADPHRPEKVQFIGDLEQDLARRDFTVNAMALDLQGRIIDPFGGQEDLKRRIIRCVGDPGERFLEDPLRVLRAARFMARTGFEADPGLAAAAALKEVRRRFTGLSVERVRDELEKVLLSPSPSRGLRYLAETEVLGLSCRSKKGSGEESVPILPEVAALEGVKQNPRFHAYDVLEHTLKTVDGTEALPALRWAALLHDVAKGRAGTRCLNKEGEPADYGHAAAGAALAGEILERLKLPLKTRRLVVWLVRCHMLPPGMDDAQMTRWVIKRSRDFNGREAFVEAARLLFQLADADNRARGQGAGFPYIEAISESFQRAMAGTVLYPAELALDGAYIARKIGPGPKVGKILGDLLVDVQKGRLANTREILQQAIEKKAGRLARKLPGP